MLLRRVMTPKRKVLLTTSERLSIEQVLQSNQIDGTPFEQQRRRKALEVLLDIDESTDGPALNGRKAAEKHNVSRGLVTNVRMRFAESGIDGVLERYSRKWQQAESFLRQSAGRGFSTRELSRKAKRSGIDISSESVRKWMNIIDSEHGEDSPTR